MEPISVIVGIVGIAVLLLIVSYWMSEYFPLDILKEEGNEVRQITYRHEFFAIFALIFVVVLMTFIPKTALDQNDNCGIYENTTDTVAGNVTHNYSYYCFTNTNTTNQTYYVYYARLKFFFWTYLGVYVIAMVFVQINNWIIRKRHT